MLSTDLGRLVKMDKPMDRTLSPRQPTSVSMTLVPFTPDKLDALALRLLDISNVLRRMSNASRDHSVTGFELHSQKPDEWLGHLEDWVLEAEGKLATAINKQRGDRRALSSPQTPPARAGKSAGTRKKKG